MMIFTKERTVRRQVTVQIPDAGDRFTPATIHVTWRIVPNDSEEAKLGYSAEFFKRVITNLEGLYKPALDGEGKPAIDGEGKPKTEPIPFTPEFLHDVLQVSYVVSAFTREYLNCTVAAGRGN